MSRMKGREGKRLAVPILTVCAIFAAALCTEEGSAEPLYDSSDCATANTVNNWTSSNQIFYYVASSFAVRMNTCTSFGVVNDPGCSRPTCEPTLSQTEAGIVVQAAAETWNRESRGPALIFGGNLTASTPQAACDAMGQRPGIWVTFLPGCQDSNGNGVCDGPTQNAALVRPVFNRPGCIELVVQGDADGDPQATTGASAAIDRCSNNGPGDGSAAPYGWRVGVDYQPQIGWIGMQAALTHEFGHTLQLGHPDAQSGGDTNDESMSRAIMVRKLGDPPYSESGWPAKRHLFIWDQDCVDDVASQRAVEYQWRGYDQSGWSAWTSVSSDSDQTQKSFISGGHLRYSLLDGSAKAYGRFDMTSYGVSYLDWGTVNSNGVLELSSFSSNIVNVYANDIYSPATIWTPRDADSGQGHDTRMLYVPRWDTFSDFVPSGSGGKADIDNEDPPQMRYLDTDDLFQTGTMGKLEACTGFSPCAAEPIRSHLPLSVAWDPVSGKSAVVSVITARQYAHATNPDDLHDNGQIRVHPGFTSSAMNTLLRGSNLENSGTSLAAEEGWPSSYETDSPPGVACGPSGTGPSSGGNNFNCLLAWVDRGFPGGRVRYTWFRINTSLFGNFIVWFGTGYRRTGSATVSGVSAAYFDGAFWMAWKSVGPLHGVQYTSAATWPSGWGGVSTVSGVSNVVDPPTFLYVPDSSSLEAGLVWTKIITP